MSRISSLSLLILSLFCNLSPAQTMPGEKIADLGAAMDYCRTAPLAGPEGIWEFPEDMTKVLIRKSPRSPYKYDIILISSPDCRLIPGERIGEMEESADRKQLKLALYSARTGDLLTDMRHCAAEFNDRKDQLLIHPRKTKISVRKAFRRAIDLTDLLPKFWFNVSVDVKRDDPESRLPIGMVRIYPERTPSLRYL